MTEILSIQLHQLAVACKSLDNVVSLNGAQWMTSAVAQIAEELIAARMALICPEVPAGEINWREQAREANNKAGQLQMALEASRCTEVRVRGEGIDSRARIASHMGLEDDASTDEIVAELDRIKSAAEFSVATMREAAQSIQAERDQARKQLEQVKGGSLVGDPHAEVLKLQARVDALWKGITDIAEATGVVHYPAATDFEKALLATVTRIVDERKRYERELCLIANHLNLGQKVPLTASVIITAIVAQVDDLHMANKSLAGYADQAQKGEAFKRWVHEFLDELGVPKEPDLAYGTADCRIGRRMRWCFGGYGLPIAAYVEREHSDGKDALIAQYERDAAELSQRYTEVSDSRDLTKAQLDCAIKGRQKAELKLGLIEAGRVASGAISWNGDSAISVRDMVNQTVRQMVRGAFAEMRGSGQRPTERLSIHYPGMGDC